jgi:hypothetical protein
MAQCGTGQGGTKVRRSSRWLVAWIAVATLLVGACGTSGKKTASTTKPAKPATTERPTTTVSATTSTEASTEPDSESTTTKPASPGDEARAKAANIVASDFPAGWSATPSTPTGGGQLFQTCAPEVKLEEETLARGDSPAFDRNLQTAETRAASTARLFSSEDVATTVVGKFADTAFVACIEKSIKSSALKPGTATGSLSTERISGLGDEASGVGGAFTGVDAGTGKQAQLGISIVAVRTGNLVTILTGASAGPTQPSDGQLFQKLAQAIAERQQA